MKAYKAIFNFLKFLIITYNSIMLVDSFINKQYSLVGIHFAIIVLCLLIMKTEIKTRNFNDPTLKSTVSRIVRIKHGDEEFNIQINTISTSNDKIFGMLIKSMCYDSSTDKCICESLHSTTLKLELLNSYLVKGDKQILDLILAGRAGEKLNHFKYYDDEML